jgi:predicted nucleic acid-binding Zn ribbon protein
MLNMEIGNMSSVEMKHAADKCDEPITKLREKTRKVRRKWFYMLRSVIIMVLLSEAALATTAQDPPIEQLLRKIYKLEDLIAQNATLEELEQQLAMIHESIRQNKLFEDFEKVIDEINAVTAGWH